MRAAKAVRWMVVGVAAVMVASGARTDWDPGGPSKMHYPQLPDPQGWDVAFTTWVEGVEIPVQLADDWKCAATGPVSDIHFWVSWEGDRVGAIAGVWTGIYSNVPVGPQGYSEPGELLWENHFQPGQFLVRQYDEGPQGWYEPLEPDVVPDDHMLIFQVNIDRVPDPFIQREGEIYWLALQIPALNGEVGWKTSLDHWNDDAVIRLAVPNGGPEPWHELHDPVTGESLDLAFVITPEPATLALMGLGAAALAARRRRKEL